MSNTVVHAMGDLAREVQRAIFKLARKNAA
jgi:hypothetical protein